MFNREDYKHKPNMTTMSEYVNNSLWDKFVNFMKEEYNIKPIFAFSKCNWEYGWNVKFKKNNKSLCTLYPRENHFIVMIVIGKKEKDSFEEILPSLNKDIQQLYLETKEGNSQKWLMIELEDDDKRYDDVKKLSISVEK